MGRPASWVEQGLRESPRLRRQVDGDSDLVLICVDMPGGRGLDKGTMASANTSVREKAAPPGLALTSDNSVPTYVPGAF